MGRSAVAGGVILAAIEGVSLLMSRVIMPAVEKQYQQAELGSAVAKKKDKLIPPVDPARKLPRYRSSISRINSGSRGRQDDRFLDEISKQSQRSSSNEQGSQWVSNPEDSTNTPPKSTSSWKLW